MFKCPNLEVCEYEQDSELGTEEEVLEAGWMCWEQNKNLKKIKISNCDIETVLAELGDCKDLSEIYLDNTKVNYGE